jgi:hypothetical protein
MAVLNVTCKVCYHNFTYNWVSGFKRVCCSEECASENQKRIKKWYSTTDKHKEWVKASKTKVILCTYCKAEFSKRPTEVTLKNFCCKAHEVLYRKSIKLSPEDKKKKAKIYREKIKKRYSDWRKTYYQYNSDALKKASRKWAKDNKDRVNERNKKYQKKDADTLSDTYIKKNIQLNYRRNGASISMSEITTEMIQQKRFKIKLNREINEKQRKLKSSGDNGRSIGLLQGADSNRHNA